MPPHAAHRTTASADLCVDSPRPMIPTSGMTSLIRSTRYHQRRVSPERCRGRSAKRSQSQPAAVAWNERPSIDSARDAQRSDSCTCAVPRP